MRVRDLRDFEILARNELPVAAYSYFAGGSFTRCSRRADSAILATWKGLTSAWESVRLLTPR